MPTTVGRARGRQSVHAGAQGAVGEHFSKVMMTLITSVAVIVFALVMTKPGRVIDAATQHFMLYYAGVFALIGLAASVAVGLVATDRIVMTPGHRVMAQAAHRAVSFGALAFLVIHIVSEILAQRVHVIDSVIPFLSPYKTFYIGLGTISSDLILFIVVTSILRRRFTANGKAWRWRAIHYSAYLSFVFGILHGLLGGRAAKPYVDWSYGFAIALTALALVVRFLAISLRPEERTGAPRGADRAAGGLGYSAASPLRTAALGMAQAQLGGKIQMMPSRMGGQGAGPGLPGSQPAAALPAARGWPSSSGPLPALSAAPAYVAEPHAAYDAAALMPLRAPIYGEVMRAATEGYPYSALGVPQPPGGPGAAGPGGGQPWHEPEYDGPPRFMGTPRKHVPHDDPSSYPYAPAGYQPDRAEGNTGPIPRVGPDPRRGSGAVPRADSGPMPRLGTGPVPRADSGPMPRLGTGPVPRADSGPMPRLGTGPIQRADSGPMPRLGTGPIQRVDTGPRPRGGTGPWPRVDSGPVPQPGSGPMPRADSGPMPRLGTGPMPRSGGSGPGTGRPAPRPGANPDPSAATGPMPAAPPRRRGSADAPRPGTRDVPGRAGGEEWK